MPACVNWATVLAFLNDARLVPNIEAGMRAVLFARLAKSAVTVAVWALSCDEGMVERIRVSTTQYRMDFKCIGLAGEYCGLCSF